METEATNNSVGDKTTVDTQFDFATLQNAKIPTDPSDNSFIVFKHPYKVKRVRLGPARYMPLSSTRLLLSGPPNSGKRNLILNILFKMLPPPSCVHVCHFDSSNSEYDALYENGIPLIMYDHNDLPQTANIEEPDEIEEGAPEDEKEYLCDSNKRLSANPVIILDEITNDILDDENRKRFERIVNYIATHKNTFVICSIQSLLNIPPRCRRGFNNYALWKQSDQALNKMVATRAGVESNVLSDLFSLCQTQYDFIYIDLEVTSDDPYRYRLNWTAPIDVEPLKTEKNHPI